MTDTIPGTDTVNTKFAGKIFADYGFPTVNLTVNQHDFIIYNNDALKQLELLPDACIDCIVTSPPYYGLRNYDGGDDEIGQENTLQDYINSLYNVFHECKRVLKPNGTLWLNIGDSYSKGRKTHGEPPRGNLCGVPYKLAFALQDDGWNLISDIIWHKSRVLPEGVKSRPSKCHEHIFMFALDAYNHTYNIDDIRVPLTETSLNRIHAYENNKDTEHGTMRVYGSSKPLHPVGDTSKGRNIRDVWKFAPSNVSGIHFATYPIALPELCIKAGCTHGGIVLDPFSGSGMTGKAALSNNRKYVGIELNPDYIKLTTEDVLKDWMDDGKRSLFDDLN